MVEGSMVFMKGYGGKKVVLNSFPTKINGHF